MICIYLVLILQLLSPSPLMAQTVAPSSELPATGAPGAPHDAATTSAQAQNPAGSSHPSSRVDTVKSGKSIIKHAGRARFSIDEKSGDVNLERGEILVVAKKLSTVKVGEQTVTVQPGSIALVRVFDGVLKVRNLYETAGNGVRANVSDRYVDLCVGQELVVGSSGSLIGKAMHADRISRRSTRDFELAENNRLVRSEFSIVSIMQNSAVLSHLMNSERKDDKAIVDKLTKMAAVMQTVTATHGAYSQPNP